jgi:hypothetical protein
MRAPTKRMSLVLDAIEIALGQLAKLPDSPEVEELRTKALVYERDAKHWSEKAPTSEQREAMMKKVLALHILVTKLAREGSKE